MKRATGKNSVLPVALLSIVLTGVFVCLCLAAYVLRESVPRDNPGHAPSAQQVGTTENVAIPTVNATPPLPKPSLSVDGNRRITIRGVKGANFYILHKRTYVEEHNTWGLWRVEGLVARTLLGKYTHLDKFATPGNLYQYRAFAMNRSGEVLSTMSDVLEVRIPK